MKHRHLEIIIALVSILFIAALYGISLWDRHPVPFVRAQEFQEWVSRNHPIIVDLREDSELAQYPLTYSPRVHLPFLQIQDHLDQIPVSREHPTLLVCSDGNRARLVAYLLNEKGIRVFYLADGLNSL